jgi:hypothetical protein
MIHSYVNKLIDNLPDNIKNTENPQIIDLVLDGGVFNGSYLVGALYFLKEMENKNYIKINKISGCSIGSIVGLLYFCDSLDYMENLYDIANKEFKKEYFLGTVKKLHTVLKDKIPKNICEIVNSKLYITYHNIKSGKKCVKCKYKDFNDIINIVVRSCYVPYLIDGNILLQEKYIDGITPYIFKKEDNSKILYLDLFGYDKIGNLLNIKNEKTNFNRILSGLLDIHNFYIKQSKTSMCSYVNEWSIIDLMSNYIKIYIEKIILLIIYFIVYIKKKVPNYFQSSLIYKIISKIIQDIFIILIETYCF